MVAILITFAGLEVAIIGDPTAHSPGSLDSFALCILALPWLSSSVTWTWSCNVSTQGPRGRLAWDILGWAIADSQHSYSFDERDGYDYDDGVSISTCLGHGSQHSHPHSSPQTGGSPLTVSPSQSHPQGSASRSRADLADPLTRLRCSRPTTMPGMMPRKTKLTAPGAPRDVSSSRKGDSATPRRSLGYPLDRRSLSTPVGSSFLGVMTSNWIVCIRSAGCWPCSVRSPLFPHCT